jgi:hypothetical protein
MSLFGRTKVFGMFSVVIILYVRVKCEEMVKFFWKKDNRYSTRTITSTLTLMLLLFF